MAGRFQVVRTSDVAPGSRVAVCNTRERAQEIWTRLVAGGPEEEWWWSQIDLPKLGPSLWGVVKIGDVIDSVTIPVAAPSQSRWNGKCVKCGSNTYTGMWQVEHESDHCRG